jgi:hypothetical protein
MSTNDACRGRARSVDQADRVLIAFKVTSLLWVGQIIPNTWIAEL